MNRGLSFAIAALQALIIAAIGIGISIAPLTLTWLLEGDGSISWLVALQVAVFAFLLATGVPVEVSAGKLLGIEFPEFAITAMPLGLTLLMALMVIRVGYRLSAASSIWPAWVGGAVTFGLIGLGSSALVNTDAVFAGEWEPLLIPAIFFGGLLVISSTFASRYEMFEGANGAEAKERVWIRNQLFSLYSKLHWSIRSVLSPAVRVGLGVVATMAAFAAFALALALGFGWIEVVRLYEGLRVSVLGGVMVTIGQLALLPNLIVYAMAWLAGPGFAIGIGSSVSPFASQLGPMPAFPVFAALPTGGFDRGILFVLVPVLAAFVGTLLVRKYVDQVRWEYATRLTASIALAAVTASVTSLSSMILAAFASGSLGPGRFEFVGVNVLQFGAVVFVEVLIPSFLAALIITKPYDPDSPRRK
ncbi:MAG: hypothetical protein EBS38_07820 [Actinobacteria bacterium]|nr:hypothetical protein [Actinomycetota bacterium]